MFNVVAELVWCFRKYIACVHFRPTVAVNFLLTNSFFKLRRFALVVMRTFCAWNWV